MDSRNTSYARFVTEQPHVVIIGGGFAGLSAAKALKRAPVRITLIDKRNHHLFQPLLYQVATAGLAGVDIAQPIRRILRRQQNVTVLLEEVEAVDPEKHELALADGNRIAYDYAIIATGVSHFYFGHPEWERHAPGLKTLEDALEIRRRVLIAYERAEAETDPLRRAEWLTFAVIGGGPTGAETAGALAEIARRAMAGDFRHFDPGHARILLLEGADRVLLSYPEALSEKARQQLETLGVEVLLGARVKAIDERGLTIEGPAGTADERLEARTIIWAAGIAASALGASLGAPTDRAGRVEVDPSLAIPQCRETFVVGDLAHIEQDGDLVPGVAPAAIQQGQHAATNILRLMAGKESAPFRYKNRGSMATIGRKSAVAVVGKLELSGLFAWLAWLTIHIFFLIGFRNRFVVLFEWAWSYLTYQRSARLILEEAGEASPSES
ncbi:MAG: NAD(P)/FAD-dependent oxidoreductase [Acidobacteriota bacterium]|nr:NAD(P)/FAD-dependent oxidoreductase [Acidobacteriota bacterium]